MGILKESSRETRRYSEALKMEVVSELEEGRQLLSEASRHYGIPKTTIRDWRKRYGRSRNGNVINKPMVNIGMKDQSDKIRELESALADAHLKIKLYDKMFELAKEDGIEVKKNTVTGQLEVLRNGKVLGNAVK